MRLRSLFSLVIPVNLNAQPNETLMSHEIPDRPLSKVGTDLFSIGDNHYLITVCYLSNFFEIDRLYDTYSKAVVNKLKAHVARYGIPDCIVSDNGPQITSDTFLKFTKMWGITHTPSSPHNSKANGKVESTVKTAKHMLKKTFKTKEDQYLALLNIRNTPSQGVESSPTQRFLGRRTRTLMPVTNEQLKQQPIHTKHIMQQIKSNQERQAKYYNRHARDLPELRTGDTVRMQPFRLGDPTWRKAEVTCRLDQRSYEVMSEGRTYRRVRQHLRKAIDRPNSDSIQETSPSGQTPVQRTPVQSTPTSNDKQQLRRSERKAKPLEKLKDYVTK